MLGLAAGGEGLDDEHAPAAARTGTRVHAGLIGVSGLRFLRLLGARRHGEQLADARDVVGAIAIGEKPIVADAMEPFRQDVHQEAPDELVRVQRHRHVPARSVDPIIL